ncbi:MAG: class C sortase [Oscillospiraceae bacterium]|nr:class C sortase [Oscillospiraceae bacterium]
MKKHIVSIAFLLGALVTLSVLLYPIVADYVNTRSQSRIVAHYFDDVVAIDDESRQAILDAAREYNQKLPRKAERFILTEAETAAYRALLDAGRGVMGILAIDKINVSLPIYHGTDEGVLQIGLGHMQGTSLPVGGDGTHAFITGHRGLPSSKLLSELNQMAEGDTFVLYVMGETLTYRVDQIRTVEPHAVGELDIGPGTDYCTLVTCTPYGVNSHRLLVRGQRTENALSTGWEAVHAGARRLDKSAAILICLIPALPVMIFLIVLRGRKIREGGFQYR